MNINTPQQDKQLFSDICQIIDTARIQVAVKANTELTLMYWHIGRRINTDVLGNQRTEYGKQVVLTLSTQLEKQIDGKLFERTVIAGKNRYPSSPILYGTATQTFAH